MGQREAMTSTPHAVNMRGIFKHFGGVQALVDVDLQINAGEIHALLGGNGAGKSTILKILNGVHVPDQGSIEVFGQVLDEYTPEASRRAGIAMIYQEMSLIPSLTVAQNVFLTRETRNRLGLIDDRMGEQKAAEYFEMLEVDINPRTLVADLGAGQRQLTEIVKAISQDARVLVLDEPSTTLSVSDVEKLFGFLRRLRSKGVAIIYVSHRMDEIARVADRATILRDGKRIITAPMSELSMELMIEHIVGKRSGGLTEMARKRAGLGEVLLELDRVSGARKPKEISLTVRRGEVVGIAGLLGSGRSSLARVLFGIEPRTGGEIRIAGRPATIDRPRHAIDSGIALVPEARALQGLILPHSVSANLTLSVLDRVSDQWIVNRRAVREATSQQIDNLGIKAASQEHAVSTLSGGNQQKVVIGKWMAADPEILILDEPTAGIDIGSKSEVIRLIRELAERGKAILLISSELNELLVASNRIAVMSGGRLAGVLERDSLDDPAFAGDDPVRGLKAAEQNLLAHIQTAFQPGSEARVH